MSKIKSVPLDKRICLTVEEASAYSGIPVRMIRKMVHLPSCRFTFGQPKQGKKLLIKRELFEEYIKRSSGKEL